MRRENRKGFTLLEVMVAMSILALALMAIFNLNAGAVSSHAYTKRLTVATLLARSKMTDVEQKLYDEGLPNDDDEDSGDFSSEGWPQFKWRSKVLAPRTTNVSPDKFISALFNVPGGGEGLGALFGGGGGKQEGGGSAANPLAAAGPMAGLVQGQFTQMLDQIGRSVREVHVTVSWKDGTQTETLDVVTHVVALGQGGDRNGNTGVPGVPGGGPNGPNGPNGPIGPNGPTGPNIPRAPITMPPVLPGNLVPQ